MGRLAHSEPSYAIRVYERPRRRPRSVNDFAPGRSRMATLAIRQPAVLLNPHSIARSGLDLRQPARFQLLTSNSHCGIVPARKPTVKKALTVATPLHLSYGELQAIAML